ncbi:hypothetical protein [Acidianus sp. HS-5]|uniref:hypothetical protein n=1 Tax=Acidianus sp. HS-5 TaxID=2886040 RepID=UPI001F2C4348|nr:hypothetical protein [Acidianus sp. HS-5]BDC17694.1 hypothetical protein HS5_05840 [Acidianus sp. HS-5]
MSNEKPFIKDPLAFTSGIIKTNLSVKELKELAEKEAEKDALERYMRRQNAGKRSTSS